MKKIFILALVFLVIILLIFGSSNLGAKNGQLSVKLGTGEAQVYVDKRQVGTTPFFAGDLKVGDKTVLVKNQSSSWETKVTLTSSTLTTINLDLSQNEKFTSGETLYFKPGNKSLTVMSKPNDATIFINSKEEGNTPTKLFLGAGTSVLTVKKTGYLSREIPLSLEDGYTLVATVYLSVDPFPVVKKLDGNNKTSLFSINNPDIDLSSSYSSWAEGVKHIQNSFAGSQTRFDVLIDPNGKKYVLNQEEWVNKVASKAVANIGYMSSSGSEQLTSAAKITWENLKSEFD